ncbi:RNA polymerase sigma factor RpoD [Limosilactobacillus fermentum 3872]|uniref:sigma-70 family RNA polymerase sigma factor n=1 Tax=Limosilactobacillus fermentum TaxID=1613 RepID=UPI000398C06C|nr:RNA polymerase sigma factor RpoD/SigA [Limosilactobacillus fermentum]ALQ81402.1 RNA polymerase sigma factor RpoD [Limosilactobacillus fermentum 3872]
MVKSVPSSLNMLIKTVRGIPLLTDDEFNTLITRWIDHHDQKARNRIVEANLRLVIKIASGYASSCPVPLEDLIQAGTTGLMKAVDDFDPTFGTKISTYATNWIRNAIQKEILRNWHITISVSKNDAYRKILKWSSELTNQLQREPTIDELVEVTGFKPAKVRELMKMPLMTELASLDKQVTDEGDPLGNLLSDGSDAVKKMDTLVETKKTHEMLERYLTKLTPREENVLRLYCGFDDGQKRGLREVGLLMGITQERTRQIRDTGARKIYKLDQQNGGCLEQQ